MKPDIRKAKQFFDIQPLQITAEHKKKFSRQLEEHSHTYLLPRHLDEFVFATARAVDIGDFYGKLGKPNWEHCVNANGDYFDYTEIIDIHPIKNIPRYKTFANSGLYRNHQSDKVENSIGFVFDSVFNIVNDYTRIISCLFGVDKMKAPDIARGLDTFPQRQGVSMGCTIKYVICTNCGTSTQNGPKCECLQRYNSRRHPITKNLVAELVKGVDFFELSFVTNPAFAFSFVLDVLKSTDFVDGRMLKVAEATMDGDLLNSLHLFSYIKQRIKTANYHDKLFLNKKLDEIAYVLDNYEFQGA